MSLPFLARNRRRRNSRLDDRAGAREPAPALHRIADGTRPRRQVDSYDATPRRLVLRADGLAAKHSPMQKKRFRAAESRPAKARRRASPRRWESRSTDLDKLQTPQRRVLQLQQASARPATHRRSRRGAARLITKIYFPKTMYWTGKGGPRFIRPIRWIVALLGDRGRAVRARRRALRQR